MALMEHPNPILLIENFKPTEHIESEYVTEAMEYMTSHIFQQRIGYFIKSLVDGNYDGNGVLVWVCEYAHAATCRETTGYSDDVYEIRAHPRTHKEIIVYRADVYKSQVKMINQTLNNRSFKSEGLSAQYVAGLSATSKQRFCKRQADADAWRATFVPLWGVVFTRKQDNNKSTVTPAMILQKRKPTIWIQRLESPFPTSDQYITHAVMLQYIEHFRYDMTACMQNLQNGKTNGKGILVWIFDSVSHFETDGARMSHPKLEKEINRILNMKPWFGPKIFKGITAQCIDQRDSVAYESCTILASPLDSLERPRIPLCAVLLTYASGKPQAQNGVHTGTICSTCHKEVLY